MADQLTPAEMRGKAHSLRLSVRPKTLADKMLPPDPSLVAFRENVLAGADALDREADREEARQRDAQHPEFVPEAVMDAAYGSQARWWVPGARGASQTVIVPVLIESVAEAVYKATREVTDASV